MTIYNLPPAKSNHYLNRYIKLITYYCKINFEGYTETHHILPKSMGGTDDKSNLIVLSARLHYIAHWLLYRAYKNQSMSYAFLMLHSSNKKQKRYYNSKIYEKLKIEYGEMMSEIMKINNPFKGKKHTEASKQKMRDAKSNMILIPWNLGMSRENNIDWDLVCSKISESKKNYRWWNNGIKEVQAETQPSLDYAPGRISSDKFKKTEEQKQKIKERMSDGNMYWWNNGVINKRQKEKPDGNNWVKGRPFSKEQYEKFCKHK